MNENYFNLIRDVTDKYDYAHKDEVKYKKKDTLEDKIIKDCTYRIDIKDSSNYGDVIVDSFINYSRGLGASTVRYHSLCL